MRTVTAWLGIDAAKQKFDVALEWRGRRRAKVFPNSAAGWRRLCDRLADLGIDRAHACLEATGRYGEGVALALYEAGHAVSILNPARIRHFARTKLGRNKTDRLDAALLAEYGRLFDPAPWHPPAPALRRLRDLVRTREALQASLTAWTNRQHAGPLAEAAVTAAARVVAGLRAELAAIEAAIEDAVRDDPDLCAGHALLVSVPGIGTQTAATIPVELPAPGVLRSAREAAAYAGLTPCHTQSGSSVNRPARLSRIGNAALRTALYFPAITARRFNPLVAAFCERLKAAGRLRPKQIVAAAMRKLLHLCYGVLKTGKPFDLHHRPVTGGAMAAA
jgi:transposase